MTLDSSSDRSMLGRQSRPTTRPPGGAAIFDGHDAAISIFRRIFQSKGCEVIHLDHDRGAGDRSCGDQGGCTPLRSPPARRRRDVHAHTPDPRRRWVAQYPPVRRWWRLSCSTWNRSISRLGHQLTSSSLMMDGPWVGGWSGRRWRPCAEDWSARRVDSRTSPRWRTDGKPSIAKLLTLARERRRPEVPSGSRARWPPCPTVPERAPWSD